MKKAIVIDGVKIVILYRPEISVLCFFVEAEEVGFFREIETAANIETGTYHIRHVFVLKKALAQFIKEMILVDRVAYFTIEANESRKVAIYRRFLESVLPAYGFGFTEYPFGSMVCFTAYKMA